MVQEHEVKANIEEGSNQRKFCLCTPLKLEFNLYSSITPAQVLLRSSPLVQFHVGPSQL